VHLLSPSALIFSHSVIRPFYWAALQVLPVRPRGGVHPFVRTGPYGFRGKNIRTKPQLT